MTRAIILAVALALAGCGNGRKAVYQVKGTVVGADGKPAAGATVVFHPATDSKDTLKPTGTTDAEGRYALTTYDKGDGAPEGEYVVTVYWPTERKTPLDPVGGDRLGGRYDKPEKSEFRATVGRGGDNTVPAIQVK